MRLALTAVFLLFCGCGALQDDPAARPTTLAEARALCVPFDPSGQGFDVMVIITRALRDDGLAESQTLLGFISTCSETCEGNDVCFEDCVNCTTAVADAVYNN